MMTATTHRRHQDRVPADRRLFGIDRRTLLPAGIVLAAAVVMHWGVPWVNDQVPYSETVPAGGTMSLGRDVRFSPPAGWGISDGVLTGGIDEGAAYPDTATVFTGATSITLETGSFEGSPSELLERIETIDEATGTNPLRSSVTTITTASGIPGVISRFRGAESDGAIAAFVDDGVGIEVVIRTPNSTADKTGALVGQVLSSITIDGTDR